MSFDEVAKNLTAEAYQQLKTAVEIGKWPDGKVLSAQQKQISLEAILHYEVANLPPEQRTGYIPPKKNGACETPFSSSKKIETTANEESPIRWQD